MQFEELVYDVRDRVATITFNRAERLNAWTLTLEKELREAIALASADDGVRSIVLTGAGRAFCAGADMSRLSASAEGAPPPASSEQVLSHQDLEQRYGYLLGVPKPIVAGINGAIAGVGVCIALYCDLRYMAAGAKLSTPYARRGLVAEHGIAWMLPRLIGPMHASDLLLSGRAVQAEEAAQMGLVKLLPAENFAEAVHQRAADLANLSSPRSVRVMKAQLLAASHQTLAEATQLADAEMALCRGTEDLREGVAHFVEKRAPKFTGR